MTQPTVTIIIPVYNEEKIIGACLDALMALNFPKEAREIIIVDDGSTDRTREIVQHYEVTLLSTEHAGPSVARNLGIARANSEYIAVTDADCIVHQDWLTRLIRVLEDNPDAAAVGGAQQAVPDDPHLARCIQRFLEMLGFLGGYTKDYRTLTAVEHNASCNAMYRRQCLLEVGGFLPGLFPGEDVELDYRMRKCGYRILYDPEALVDHHRPRTYSDFFKMIMGYGKGSGGFLLRRHGLIRTFQLLFPLFLTLFIADIFILYHQPALLIVSHLILLIVLWLVILIRVRDLRAALTILILFVITLFAWSVGFIRGLFWTGPAEQYHRFQSHEKQETASSQGLDEDTASQSIEDKGRESSLNFQR
ncbi:glycosyltransferase [bacterium]|nr:glycosyltransferase [bacterium]